MPNAQILVVETEALVALDIREKLLRSGYGVTGVVSSGKEAIANVAQTRPDLVLMDITLHGEMDGMEAADHIQRELRVPVIYLTAHSDALTLERAKLTEPYGYVLKPFEEAALRVAIEIGLYRHEKLKERSHLDRALLENLRDQALRDPLTGLYNRRHLEAELDREASRALRKGRPFALLAFDVDHFKRINDRFGHSGGDALLGKLALLLQTLFRKEDLLCRMGGDEILIALPETDRTGAELAAHRLCREVSELRVEHNGQTLDRVTVSLGIAVFPDHGSTIEVLLRKADEALYAAKARGRDQVVIAPESREAPRAARSAKA